MQDEFHSKTSKKKEEEFDPFNLKNSQNLNKVKVQTNVEILFPILEDENWFLLANLTISSLLNFQLNQYY